MSIFNEKKEALMPSQTAPISSIIGQDMTITGDLVFDSKIQVDGSIDGNLSGDFLVLSATGTINGDIEANTIVCHGKITGNIKVGELFLKKSGVINGRVETSDLSVESGGALNGEIKSKNTSGELKVVHGATDNPAPKASAPSQ